MFEAILHELMDWFAKHWENVCKLFINLCTYATKLKRVQESRHVYEVMHAFEIECEVQLARKYNHCELGNLHLLAWEAQGPPFSSCVFCHCKPALTCMRSTRAFLFIMCFLPLYTIQSFSIMAAEAHPTMDKVSRPFSHCSSTTKETIKIRLKIALERALAKWPIQSTQCRDDNHNKASSMVHWKVRVLCRFYEMT